MATFPQCNFSLDFPEILSQNRICFHRVSVSGISKIMHCGILINKPYLYVVRYPSLCVRQAGYISQTKDKQSLCDTFISDIRSLMKSVCGMKISLSRTPHNATPQLNPVPTNHSVSDSNHVKSLLEHHVYAFISQNACEYSWSSWKCGILVLPCSVSEYLVNYYGLWLITTQFYQRML